MVGCGHPAHDTRAARPDLARDAMGNAARSRAGSPARVCPLVSEARAHLQRCPGPGPPGTLDLADFRRLTGSPRRAETLSRRAQPPLARRLPTALTCKAKLRPKPIGGACAGVPEDREHLARSALPRLQLRDRLVPEDQGHERLEERDLSQSKTLSRCSLGPEPAVQESLRV